MKRALASLAAFFAAFALGPTASAADGPPPGWEVAPASPKAVSKPIDRCGDDATCHLRQAALDAPHDATPWSVVEVDFAALPLLRRLEAPKGGPPLKDAPSVRAIDGAGRPFPWPDGAKGEMRVMPAGKLGEVSWASEWTSPFFEDPKYRGMGYGGTHAVDDAAGKQGSTPFGPIELLSIDRGAAGLVYDHVVGKLEGTPQIAATLWEHADVAALPGGFGHAFREEGPEASLVLLLPEVFLGTEGSRVKLRGGFVPGNRFSTSQPFTRYALPADASATGTVTFHVSDAQRRCWLDAREAKPPRTESVLIASSRSSVEKAPRVVIFRRPSSLEF